METRGASRQSACRAHCQTAHSGYALAEILEDTHSGWALDGERFKAKSEALGQGRAASQGGAAETGE
jgi:hypothetical protein